MLTYDWITILFTNGTTTDAYWKMNLLYTNHMLAYCEIRWLPSSKKKKRREVGTTVPRIFLILLLNIKSIPITVDALFWVLGFVLQAQSGTIANNCPRVVRSGLDIQMIRVLQGHLLPITNSYPQNGAQH